MRVLERIAPIVLVVAMCLIIILSRGVSNVPTGSFENNIGMPVEVVERLRILLTSLP